MFNNHTCNSVNQTTGKFSSRIKTLIFVLQISFVLAFLILWLSSDSLQKSKNLWVLFFYSFPSEFLIAVVPHEPILLYFGKFYQPLTVALVGIAGTLLTEILNYSVFKYVADSKIFNKVRQGKTVSKIVVFFKKAPFIALWIAGFTPIPFYPFRFLVVIARYPLKKYALAVFLSRTPRFFLLALIGHTIKIPDYLLIVLFVALLAAIYLPILNKFLKKRKTDKKNVP